MRHCIAPLASPTFSGNVYANMLRNTSGDAMLYYGGSNDIDIGSGNPSQFVTLTSGGSERIRINTTGNIEIGTKSPT